VQLKSSDPANNLVSSLPIPLEAPVISATSLSISPPCVAGFCGLLANLKVPYMPLLPDFCRTEPPSVVAEARPR
jgi:hypothetical protein